MELRLTIRDVGQGRLHVELSEYYVRGETRAPGRTQGHRLFNGRLAGELLHDDDLSNLHLAWGVVGVILDEVDPPAAWNDETLPIDFSPDVTSGGTRPGG